MPKINLRSYLAYIEGRLSRGAYDEVSTQCRHILSAFPRYIDVYRLFARSLLEKRQYQDALDLFQRVLSADPCDFVSHIGVSDCYEESGALDQAIWHLERALEQAPNNADLKHEIQQLYQERDGGAPPRLQLSAGALARLYAGGGLYDKAIAELRMALDRDPGRVDLSLLLANALWHNHDHVAAGRLAAEIHRILPNSIDANRLLARLWLEAGQPAEAAPFIARLKQLDPYLGYEVECGEPARDNVAEIEMLVRANGQYGGPNGAIQWLTQIQSIGKEAAVMMAPEATPAAAIGGRAEPPAWLREAMDRAPALALGGANGASSGAPDPIDLKQLFQDDEPATTVGGVETKMTDMADDTGNEPQENTTPDWLQEVLGGEPGAEREPAASDVPDWLEETLARRPAAGNTDADDAPDEDLPPWLSEALGESSPGNAPGSPPSQEATVISRSGQREAPGWLADILRGAEPEEGEADEPAPPDVVSDAWLDQLLTSDDAEAAPSSAGSASGEGTPAWLRELNTPLESPPPPTPLSDLAEDGDVETWDAALQSGSQASGGWLDAPGESPVDAPAEPAVEPPAEDAPRLEGGLPGGAEPAAEEGPAADADPWEDSETPGWMDAAEEPAPARPAGGPEPLQYLEEDTLPDWLNDVGPVEDPPEMAGAGQTPEPDNPGIQPDDHAAEAGGDIAGGMRRDEDVSPLNDSQAHEGGAEDIPDWLAEGDLDSDEAIEWLEELAAKYDPSFQPTAKSSGAAESGPAAPASDELPGWLAAAAEEPKAEEPSEDEGDALGWLDAQVAEQGVSAGEPISEALAVDFPPTEPPPAPGVAGEAQPAGDDELPEWLREPDAKGAIERAIESSPEDYEASLEGVGDLEVGDDELAWLDSALESDDVDVDADELEAIFSEANGEKPEIAPAAEAAEPAPAAESDSALPEWLLDTDELAWSDEAEVVLEDAAPAADDLPAWLKGETEAAAETEPEAAPEAAPAEAEAEAEPAAEPDLPEWLAASDEKPEAGISEGVDVMVTAPGAEPTDLPAWLKDDLAAEAEAAADEEEEAEAEPAEALEAEAPEAVAEPQQAEDAEEDVVPVAEGEAEAAVEEEPEAAAEEAPAAVAEAEAPEPVAEEEAVAEPLAEAETPEPEAEAEAELAYVAADEAAEEAADTVADDYERLRIAREKLGPKTIGEAVPHYEQLIGSGERLDETVADLNYYLRSEASPDPRVRRLLGDALRAQGKLQDALDAYRQALDAL